MERRNVCRDNLRECLSVEPRHFGDEIVGSECAMALWVELLHNRSFNAVAFECAPPKNHVVAFGASVFVDAGFVTQELQRPRTNLNSRLLSSMANNRSAVLKAKELCSRGTDRSLDIVILACAYLYSMPLELVREAQMLLAYTFAELHKGYPLNRILIETTSEEQRAYHQSSGVWRLVHSFPCERALLTLTRDDAYAVSGSIAADLFHFEEPVLDLRDADKELLADALQGGTDADLAARLHLSVASIKKRWESLFGRVAELRPDLLPCERTSAAKDARGPQKRHHILNYVRSHPGEIRPFH